MSSEDCATTTKKERKSEPLSENKNIDTLVFRYYNLMLLSMNFGIRHV